jgi:hypothetical protein
MKSNTLAASYLALIMSATDGTEIYGALPNQATPKIETGR